MKKQPINRLQELQDTGAHRHDHTSHYHETIHDKINSCIFIIQCKMKKTDLQYIAWHRGEYLDV